MPEALKRSDEPGAISPRRIRPIWWVSAGGRGATEGEIRGNSYRAAGSGGGYGHSAGTSDAHIYEALFTANIDHLYFCVYEPSGDLAEIDSRLSAHQKRLASNVGYTLIDAESAGLAGGWRAQDSEQFSPLHGQINRPLLCR